MWSPNSGSRSCAGDHCANGPRRSSPSRIPIIAGGSAMKPGRSGSSEGIGSPMAYDEELAFRIRELLIDERALTEKRMFGGLAFMVDGHLAVAASGRGGLMVRVDPDRAATYLRGAGVEAMEMRGRAMAGW